MFIKEEMTFVRPRNIIRAHKRTSISINDIRKGVPEEQNSLSSLV